MDSSLFRDLPSRDGSRGGKANFKWSDVKDDKYRQNYLGHSLKAPVGRWQEGKDLTWYAKGKGSEDEKRKRDEERRAEIRKIKQQEKDALAEALGFAVEKRVEGNVTDQELQKALPKAAEVSVDDYRGRGHGADKGVGYASRNRYEDKPSSGYERNRSERHHYHRHKEEIDDRHRFRSRSPTTRYGRT